MNPGLFGTEGSDPGNKIYSVTEIVGRIQDALEQAYPNVWVEGELSNFKAAGSGHYYFTLKDAESNLRGVMFRGANQYLKFSPADGLKVLARGRITLYKAKGDCQMIVESLQPSGKGELQLAFEQMREKLRAEGLFDLKRKKPVPRMPERVAVITSPTGAVLRDIIKIARRRAPTIQLVLYPARVQGKGASEEICRGLRELNEAGGFDVILLARGGGSLEDLWAFNEESVARAIAASAIPVVSAIGHEVDYTISDFVADLRAPTPSAAVEQVMMDRGELMQSLRHQYGRIRQALLGRIAEMKERLAGLRKCRVLSRPGALVETLTERLDGASEALQKAFSGAMEDKGLRLGHVQRNLHAVSPLAILERGYSVTWKQPEHEIIFSPEQVAPGDLLKTQVSRGILVSRLERKG